MCKYNEWTNYETWNVMLWLNNEETLYFSMIAMLQNSDFPLTYRALIIMLPFFKTSKLTFLIPPLYDTCGNSFSPLESELLIA